MTDSDKFTVAVITPLGPVVEEVTKEIILETSQGQVTILPKHINYLTQLGSGVLNFTAEDGTEHKFVTSGGFCNSHNGSLLILADYVDFRKDLDTEEIIKRGEELETQLNGADLNNPANKLLLEELSRNKAQAELVSH